MLILTSCIPAHNEIKTQLLLGFNFDLFSQIRSEVLGSESVRVKARL